MKTEVLIIKPEEIDFEIGKDNQIKQHTYDVHHDADEANTHKLHGAMCIAQIGQRDVDKGINRHTCAHNHDEFGVVGIANAVGNRMQKQRHECDEKHRSGGH